MSEELQTSVITVLAEETEYRACVGRNRLAKAVAKIINGLNPCREFLPPRWKS